MADIFGNPLGTPPPSGDFSRGVKQSFQELKGTGYGLLGLTGAGLGIQGLKDYGLENAQEAFGKSAAMSKPTDQLEGIESFGDAADYLQRGLGYVAGQALPSVLTGGIGAIIGKKLAQRGIQSLTEKEIAYLSTRAAQRGAMTGAALTSYGQEAGSIYPEMVQEGHDEPGRAAAFALPAAALDVLPEMRIIKKFFPFANEGVEAASKGIVRRVATEGGKQALAEGVTEGAQTAIERAAAYKSLNDKEAWSEYANAAALGALGGGVLGGATGAFKSGSSLMPTANPQMQGELDLGEGGGGQPNANADMLNVGPIQEPTTVGNPSQPDLFAQQHSFDPSLKATAGSVIMPNQAADQLAQITPKPTTPSGIILPGQEPTTLAPQPTPQIPQIVVPGQPEPATEQIVLPKNGPDIHTAYAVAMRKKERGELLTPFEVYLTKEQPGRTPVPVAKDRTVVRPSEAEEAANYAASQFGYTMTPKRLTVAKAAEEAKMQGRLDEASYDQIHTLLGQSKLGKAASVLLESTKEATPNEKQETPVPAQVPQRQEAPVRQDAPVANDAPVQEVGRQDEKPGLLDKPVKKKEAKPKKPVFDPREKYEDNHQAGEPTYDELSKEDRAIWDDNVANGIGTIEQYDKFQKRLKRNSKVKVAPKEEGEDIPSISGTIRKGVDILRKAPPAVLNRIKVKTATAENVPIREALSAIDKELEGYKIILKCVG